MKRIDFIKTCGLTCAGIAVAAVLPGCASTVYTAKSYKENNKLVVLKSEFILSQENKTYRQFVLATIPQLSYPVCIYKTGDEYTALLMECTHKSCELKPQGNYLVCPCHGSEFTNKGIVKNPPAEENLKSFTVTTDNEKIYIHL